VERCLVATGLLVGFAPVAACICFSPRARVAKEVLLKGLVVAIRAKPFFATARFTGAFTGAFALDLAFGARVL